MLLTLIRSCKVSFVQTFSLLINFFLLIFYILIIITIILLCLKNFSVWIQNLIIFINFSQLLDTWVKNILCLLFKYLDSAIPLRRYWIKGTYMIIYNIAGIISCIILVYLNRVEICYISRRRCWISLHLRRSSSEWAKVTHSTFKSYEIHLIYWLICSLNNT